MPRTWQCHGDPEKLQGPRICSDKSVYTSRAARCRGGCGNHRGHIERSTRPVPSAGEAAAAMSLE